MDVALRALLELRPDGVQLTPGNQPTHQFERLLDGVTTRTHHGFEPRVWKRTVWNDDGSCAVSGAPSPRLTPFLRDVATLAGDAGDRDDVPRLRAGNG
jgi:hypothetical protein